MVVNANFLSVEEELSKIEARKAKKKFQELIDTNHLPAESPARRPVKIEKVVEAHVVLAKSGVRRRNSHFFQLQSEESDNPMSSDKSSIFSDPNSFG
jgi:hypothetical protein